MLNQYVSKLKSVISGIVTTADQLSAIREARRSIVLKEKAHPDFFPADSDKYSEALEKSKALNAAFDQVMAEFDGKKVSYFNKSTRSNGEYAFKWKKSTKARETKVFNAFVRAVRFMLDRGFELSEIDQFLKSRNTWNYLELPRSAENDAELSMLSFYWCKDQARYGWCLHFERRGKIGAASGLGKHGVDRVFSPSYKASDSANVQ